MNQACVQRPTKFMIIKPRNYESMQHENENDKKDSKMCARNKRKARNNRKSRTTMSSAQSDLNERMKFTLEIPVKPIIAPMLIKLARWQKLLAIQRRALYLPLRTMIHLPSGIMIMINFSQLLSLAKARHIILSTEIFLPGLQPEML